MQIHAAPLTKLVSEIFVTAGASPGDAQEVASHLVEANLKGHDSHGIGMTPDETQIWLADGANSHVHIFDNTQMPPVQMASIKLREQPGWVTFSIDGSLAYPSTGEVIDVRSRKIVARLSDETGREVHSEKMLEIDFVNGQPIRTGDQFGLGQRE